MRLTDIVILLVLMGVLLIACGTTPTGIPEVDQVIDAALEGDPENLMPLIAFTSTQCTHADGLGGPPKCRNGESEGSPVEVLPFLGTEGHFTRKEEMASWPGLEASRLHAVYRVSDQAYSEPNYPAGEYAVVLLGKDGVSNVTLQVRAGNIVRVDWGPETPPAIPAEVVGEFLYGPE